VEIGKEKEETVIVEPVTVPVVEPAREPGPKPAPDEPKPRPKREKVDALRGTLTTE
jgi:hypothetical protein